MSTKKTTIKVSPAVEKLVMAIIKLSKLRYKSSSLGIQDSGNNYKIRCPFHPEDAPSMLVHKSKPMVKCFGCGVFFTNPAAVLKKARTERYISDDTFWEMVKELDLDTKCLKAGGVKTYHDTEVRMLEFFKELHNLFVLTFKDNLTKENAEYLTETRGLELSFLERSNLIGQVPFVGEISKLFDSLRISKNFKEEVIATFSLYEKQFAFPIQATGGEVVGFLIRGREKSSMGQVYANKLFNKSVFPEGGFIGISSLSNRHMDVVLEEGVSSAIMVEGPFDMLQTLKLVQHANVPRLPLAYKHCTGRDQVDELHNLGINTLYYIPDDDPTTFGELSAGIKNVLRNFPMTMNGFIMTLQTLRNLGARDIDDAVKMSFAAGDGAVDILIDQMFLGKVSSFLPVDQFILQEILDHDTLSLPVLEELAKKTIKLMENPTYVVKALEALNKPELKTMTDALNVSVKDHIDDVLTDQILDVITSKYNFLFKEVDTQNSFTFVYCVYERRVYEILLESKGIETFLINMEGDIIEWFESNFSGREILRATEKQRITSDFVIRRIIDLTKRAFSKIVVGLPMKSSFLLKTHGVHKLEGFSSLLLVNGNTYIKFNYKAESSKVTKPDIEVIDVPIVGNFIIETEKCKYLLPDKLEKPSEFLSIKFDNYAEIYRQVRTIVKCWSWGGAHFEALLAGYLCTVWVQIMFPYTMSPFFTAEKSSGKTKFLSLLAGEQGTPPLLPGSMAVTDASAAGLRSIVGSSTIPMYLDEFEPRNKNFEQLLAFLRSLTTGGGKTIRGTQKGTYTEYDYKTPIGLAAINTLQGDADNSRFTYIPLHHEDNHDDPLDMLKCVMSDEELVELSYNLIRYPIRFLGKLREAYNTMKDIISVFREKQKIPTRASMNMCLPFAMVGMVEGFNKATAYFDAYLSDPKIKAFSQFNAFGKEVDQVLDYITSTEYLYNNTEGLLGQHRSLYYFLERQVPLRNISSYQNSVCIFEMDGSVYAAVLWTMFKAWLAKSHFKTTHVITLETLFLNASLDKRVERGFLEEARTKVAHFREYSDKYISITTSFSILDITGKVRGFIRTIGNEAVTVAGVAPGVLD
ncbi:MAG: CHC2 zinc finger domain-containing protein [Anaerovoracaceae bacterium]